MESVEKRKKDLRLLEGGIKIRACDVVVFLYRLTILVKASLRD